MRDQKAQVRKAQVRKAQVRKGGLPPLDPDHNARETAGVNRPSLLALSYLRFFIW